MPVFNLNDLHGSPPEDEDSIASLHIKHLFSGNQVADLALIPHNACCETGSRNEGAMVEMSPERLLRARDRIVELLRSGSARLQHSGWTSRMMGHSTQLELHSVPVVGKVVNIASKFGSFNDH
jgi:hypothetical protein